MPALVLFVKMIYQTNNWQTAVSELFLPCITHTHQLLIRYQTISIRCLLPKSYLSPSWDGAKIGSISRVFYSGLGLFCAKNYYCSHV
jgi:hypothetical protein